MSDIDYVITEEQYNEIMKLEKEGKITAYIETLLPESIILGYGFYGVNSVYRKGKECFANIRIGDSCD